MSYDVKRDTITIGETVYDVDREDTSRGERLTVSLDGERVFDGLSAVIENEEYIEEFMNPRADVDGLLGAMLTWHPHYELGGGKYDKNLRDGPDFMATCPACEGSGELTIFALDGSEIMECEQIGLPGSIGPFLTRLPDCGWCQGAGEVDLHPIDWAKQEHGARVCLPLHFYEHSGCTISAGAFGARPGYPFDCPWDAGIVGIIFDTDETREECGWEDRSDDEIAADLRAEVEFYARYLEGDVRYWAVDDDAIDYHESCGGYIGPDDEIEAEVFANLERAIGRRLAERAERDYWAARDVATVAA
jgi:hypothetical protein